MRRPVFLKTTVASAVRLMFGRSVLAEDKSEEAKPALEQNAVRTVYMVWAAIGNG